MAKILTIVQKAGNAASGYHGHAGRVGLVGGSQSAKNPNPGPIDEATRIKRERYALAERARYRAYTDEMKLSGDKDKAKAAGLVAWRARLADYDADMAQRAQHPPLNPPTQHQPAAKTYKDGLFFGGDLSQVTGSKEVYEGSHPDVQKLARETGLLATDLKSYEYIQQLQKDGKLVDINANSSDKSLASEVANLESRLVSQTENWDYGHGSPYSTVPGSRVSRYGYVTYDNLAKMSIDDPHSNEANIAMQGTEAAVRDLGSAHRNGSLDGPDETIYATWQTKTNQVLNQLKSAGVNIDSTGENTPGFLIHEARMAGLLTSWKWAVENKKLPVYDEVGNVVRTQPLSAELRKRIDGTLQRADDQDLVDVHNLYNDIMTTRSDLREGEYYTPGGDQILRRVESSRTGNWTNSGPQYHYETIKTNTNVMITAINTLRQNYAGQSLEDHQKMLGEVKKIMGTTWSGDADGKPAMSLWTTSYFQLPGAVREEIRDAADHAWKLNQVNEYVNGGRAYYYSIPVNKPIKSTDVDWSKDWDGDNVKAAYRKANPQNYVAAKVEEGKFKTYAALSYASEAEFKKVRGEVWSSWDKVQHGGFGVKINAMFRIISDEGLIQEHAAIGRQIGGDELTSYHGTCYKYSRYIAAEGFKIKPTGDVGSMLGRGIYLATKASKSCQYLEQGNVTRMPGTKGILFTVHTYLGKVYQCQDGVDSRCSSKFDRILKDGTCDTIWAKQGVIGLLNEEACSGKARASMPTYWMDSELVDRSTFLNSNP